MAERVTGDQGKRVFCGWRQQAQFVRIHHPNETYAVFFFVDRLGSRVVPGHNNGLSRFDFLQWQKPAVAMPSEQQVSAFAESR